MYIQHPNVVTPPDETVIWRYMTVEKYLSLLAGSKLFLCRLDQFEDTWEGVWPKKFTDAVRESLKARGIADYNNIHSVHRDILFVSCWHANDYESAAMWDLYSSKSSGVAIRTTVGDLKDALAGEVDYMLGQVEYVDIETDPRMFEFNVIIPAYLKRMSFKHENEVRLVRLGVRNPDDSNGPRYPFLEINVDLSKLLKNVYFSPSMPMWLVDSIKEVGVKFGLVNIGFTQSTLYSDYVY